MKQEFKGREDILISELCAEIDEWKLQSKYWQGKYKEERDINIQVMNERLEESKKGVANVLMFCLSVKDNEDGSLSISKENRKQLVDNIKS